MAIIVECPLSCSIRPSHEHDHSTDQPIRHGPSHRVRTSASDHGDRVPALPLDRNDEFILARLWAAGRGVVSHDSALLVHELCDINPSAVHLTIPTSYRISRAGGERYQLHRADLLERDITRIDAVVLTTVQRTLTDSVGHVEDHLVRQAIETASQRGAITGADRDRLTITLAAGAST